MEQIRKLRIEERIRNHIMSLIVCGNVRDPRVHWGINVTRVKVSGDLSTVKVYISSATGGNEALFNACKGLNSGAGFIRMTLGKILKSRNTPNPIFLCDNKIPQILRTIEILNTVSSDGHK